MGSYRLLQILTFDADCRCVTDCKGAGAHNPKNMVCTEWYEMVQDVSSGMPGIFIFLMVFVTITGIGLMNLIVGCMVEQSFVIVQNEKTRLKSAAVTAAKEALLQAKSTFTSTIEAEKKKTLNNEDIAKRIMITMPQLVDVLHRNPQLATALAKGGINNNNIKHIFSKLAGPGVPVKSFFLDASSNWAKLMLLFVHNRPIAERVNACARDKSY